LGYPLIVIPAIDLKDGKCVRLAQGDFNRVNLYAEDPVAIAKQWQSEGAPRIHVVDLDGSLAGLPKNKEVVKRIVEAIDIPIQIGGGIRDIETIETYLAMGVKWVILGTMAIRNPLLVETACKNFQGHIIVGIDAKNGRAAIQGWTLQTDQSPVGLAKLYEGFGLEAIIYTDIKRDGMEVGVNVEATKRLSQSVNVPVIASGGVSGMQDIENLMEAEPFGVMGVIVGKALYTGALSLERAIALTQKGRG
jgi:phosphoribosylformimino-5-aminoimidazole carboxamide ribotide isomerase